MSDVSGASPGRAMCGVCVVKRCAGRAGRLTGMNEINRRPAYTVAELASTRQNHNNWPTTMERAVEGGQAAAYPECGISAGGRRQRGRLLVGYCTEEGGRGRMFHRTQGGDSCCFCLSALSQEND